MVENLQCVKTKRSWCHSKNTRKWCSRTSECANICCWHSSSFTRLQYWKVFALSLPFCKKGNLLLIWESQFTSSSIIYSITWTWANYSEMSLTCHFHPVKKEMYHCLNPRPQTRFTFNLAARMLWRGDDSADLLSWPHLDQGSFFIVILWNYISRKVKVQWG